MKLNFSKYLLIFGIIYLSANNGFSQVGIHLDKIEISNNDHNIFSPLSYQHPDYYLFYSFSKKAMKESLKRKMPPKPIPQIYSFDELALFCKIEVKIEKALKKNFKFRLGTLDYVNRLEQKY